MKWALDIEEFSEQYSRAREMLLDHWAEETIEIADDGSNDWIEREKADGRIEIKIDDEHIKRSHLRVHTRMWHLERLKPKKYGNRIHQELTGANGGPIETKNADALTDEQLAAIASRGSPAPAKPETGAD